MPKKIVLTFRYFLLILGLGWCILFHYFSQADEIKGADASPAQTPKGLIPDQSNNPNPAISNPSLEARSGSNSPDQSPQAPPAVQIQEGTNAED
jgi:hypothetical protein